MRRFPDSADACVASVAGISPQARAPTCSTRRAMRTLVHTLHVLSALAFQLCMRMAHKHPGHNIGHARMRTVHSCCGVLLFTQARCMLSEKGLHVCAVIRWVVPERSRLQQDLEEPDAKAAFVWILGHYGESIQVRDAQALPCGRRAVPLDGQGLPECECRLLKRSLVAVHAW